MPSGLSQPPGVGEVSRADREVGVGGVLDGGEVGVAGVEVDGPGTDEDDGVEMDSERVGCVEQRRAGADIERIRIARHPRSPSSTGASPRPVTVLGPVLSAGRLRAGSGRRIAGRRG